MLILCSSWIAGAEDYGEPFASAVAQTVDRQGWVWTEVGGSASGTAEALRLFRAVSGGRRTERASSSPPSVGLRAQRNFLGTLVEPA